MMAEYDRLRELMSHCVKHAPSLPDKSSGKTVSENRS